MPRIPARYCFKDHPFTHYVRLYLRAPKGRGYTPIGWFCPMCGHVRPDNYVLPERHSLT